MKSGLNIGIALVITVLVLLLGYLSVRVLHQLAPPVAFAVGILAVPLASALGVFSLATRSPRASTIHIFIYFFLSLPLLILMLFVVGVTRGGVQF